MHIIDNSLTGNLKGTNILLNSGKPTIPTGKQPFSERKYSDPSSCFPKGERYPIPASFEYRVRVKETELFY